MISVDHITWLIGIALVNFAVPTGFRSLGYGIAMAATGIAVCVTVALPACLGR